jgi:hypothetical protein
MSTRAIIAVPTAKGYKTAWCWCNGFPEAIGKTLKTKFTTKAHTEELDSYHSFQTVHTRVEHNRHITWRKKENIHFEDDKFIELSNGCFLMMQLHNGKTVAGSGKYGFFRTIDEMLEQDLNYVYVFETESGKWKTYK